MPRYKRGRREPYRLRKQEMYVIDMMRNYSPTPVTFPDLQLDTGFTKSTLQRILARLTESGRVLVVEPGSQGRGHVSTYRLAPA